MTKSTRKHLKWYQKTPCQTINQVLPKINYVCDQTTKAKDTKPTQVPHPNWMVSSVFFHSFLYEWNVSMAGQPYNPQWMSVCTVYVSFILFLDAYMG